MRVLVLDNECRSSHLLQDLLAQASSNFQRREACDPDTVCDAVLVLNDGRDRGAGSLHSALELRNAKPGLPIAVLTLLDGDEDRDEALVRGLSLPGPPGSEERELGIEQLRSIMEARTDRVRTRISEDAVTFEYQG